MPKKGKGKGKKGKKGKKSKKTQEKEENAIKTGIHNSNLWEARLNLMDLSRKHYRDIAGTLANENEGMRDHMRQTEKDTIEVVTFLKKQEVDKDTELDRLQEQVKMMKGEHRKMKDEMIGNFTREKRELEEKIMRRESELEIHRHELSQVKEFQKKKSQMQKELEEIKEAMIWNEREHKHTLDKLEQKCFEEKMRLQQESNQKIEEISMRAQDEALKSLSETNRHVFQENAQLIESLRQLKEQLDEMKKFEDFLHRQIAQNRNEKELNEILIKEKLEQIQKQTHQIRELKEKIRLLENSLTQFLNEFDKERKDLIEKSRIEHEKSRDEILRLQRTLEYKTKEMNQVKKLGKSLIDQRTELETFFLDGLQYIKRQITLNRLQYRKDAFNAYQSRMFNAHTGQGDYPRIRTFNETFNEFSTNSVFHDLEQASKWNNMNTDVDITDLTWEQKEQVLRTLFIQMNTHKSTTLVIREKSENDVNQTLTTTTTTTEENDRSPSSTTPSGVTKLPQITSTTT